MKTVKHHKKMQGIAATRIRLGLTQETFARALGISRSTLTMAESRRRSLPSAALIKLSQLEILLAEAPVIHNKDLSSTNVNSAPGPADGPQPCSAKALHCQHRLQTMQERHRQLQQAISDIQYLLQNAAANTEAIFTASHLEMQLRLLQLKLADCSPPAQQKLVRKIARLGGRG